MKKISAIVLAFVLVLTMSVPFCASAADTTKFTIPTVEVKAGATEATVLVNYETSESILNGKFEISFPADKLELVVPEKNGKPAENSMAGWAGSQVNVNDAADGKIIVAAALSDIMDPTGTVVTMNFKLKEAATTGDIAEIKMVASEWVTEENTNLAATPIEATGKIVVAAVDSSALKAAADKTVDLSTYSEETVKAYKAALDAAKAVLAKADATQAEIDAALAALNTAEAALAAPAAASTTTTTTAASSKTGEATPWALLATVTMAGAALVVLSTKKSK